MKVIILAGGLGTRIAEETHDKPKPMVLIGTKPILWHIINSFACQGFSDFVIALGYKGEIIEKWIFDLGLNKDGDVLRFYSENSLNFQGINGKKLNIVGLRTGLNSQTGGRILKCMSTAPFERVLVTYGDGLSNVNIPELIQFHESHGKIATVTAVRPPARFGHLELNGDSVIKFGEKNQTDAGWINGGFFILEPKVIDFILNDLEPFEVGALPRLALAGELMAYKHHGFWQPMDTLREKNELSKLSELTSPPWLQF
jgi:glucose-1-phosphate cytidylyltransferase